MGKWLNRGDGAVANRRGKRAWHRARAGLLLLALAGSAAVSFGQVVPASAQVHFVWMGGDDCPPCVVWRKEQLPKLQASPEFQAVRFSYVEKRIRSSVPPLDALPLDLRPYKAALDEASAGRSGSPQAAVLVNGVVYDYFFGIRSAESIESMLAAIRTGDPYPFPRCLKLSNQRGVCAVPG